MGLVNLAKLSYDADFLYMRRHPFQEVSSLLLEFWPQNFLCQSDCVIFLHKISPENINHFLRKFASS